MSTDLPVPETKVLAIASHVVYGYVGNTMAALVMQSLGCEVAALNTVQFSNHTAYRQVKGTKASADEIRDIYDGLKQSSLTDFDVMLSGYAPSAGAVEAVGAIGRDLQLQAVTKPGSFIWALDPVMGDQGHLYVDGDVVPVYKNLLRHADLILPNQFELEILSDTKIHSVPNLVSAIETLHRTHRIPHIIVTSVRFTASSPTLCVIGSSRRADCSPRLFRIDIPAIDCFFSGTGDMFAALTVVRLREAVMAATAAAAGHPSLSETKSWLSPDEVETLDLPLAKAVEKVLASMQAVLEKTKAARDRALEGMGASPLEQQEGDGEKRMHLKKTKAAEVRVVRNLEDLREPKVMFKAEALDL